MAQFLYFDRHGDSLIVASTHDGEIASLKKSGGARVITNFNVTDRSVGSYPCWRYDTAADLLRRLELNLATPSIDYFRTVLDGVHISGYTAYSNIFDIANATAYVYRAQNFLDVRVIDLRAVLAEGPPEMMTLEAYFEATAEDQSPRTTGSLRAAPCLRIPGRDLDVQREGVSLDAGVDQLSFGSVPQVRSMDPVARGPIHLPFVRVDGDGVRRVRADLEAHGLM